MASGVLESVRSWPSRLGTRLDRNGLRRFWLLCAGVLVAQLVLLALYSAYLYGRDDLSFDFATYAQAWFQIAHGHLDPLDTIPGGRWTFLHNHFELALWPMALEYFVYPSAADLLFTQDLAIVAAELVTVVWVVAVIGDRVGSRRRVTAFSTLALFVVVSSPWWYEAASFDAHFEVVGAAPFVIATGYLLWSGRPRAALATLAVALLFGDVAALSVLLVSVAALVSPRARSRSGTWTAVAAAGASAAWLALIVVVKGNQGSAVAAGYAWLSDAKPSTPQAAALLHAVAHPGTALSVLGRRAGQIGRIVGSAGALGILTIWGAVVVIGLLLPASLNKSAAFVSLSGGFQNLVSVPLISVGTAMVLTTVACGRSSPPRSGAGGPDGTARVPGVARWRPACALGLAGACVAAATLASVTALSQLRVDWWTVDAPAAAMLRTAALDLPPTVEVIVSSGVTGRFAERTYLFPYTENPQRFPVEAASVAFVLAALEGRSTVSPRETSLAIHDVSQLRGAHFIIAAHGVVVAMWRPPPGRRFVVLP